MRVDELVCAFMVVMKQDLACHTRSESQNLQYPSSRRSSAFLEPEVIEAVCSQFAGTDLPGINKDKVDEGQRFLEETSRPPSANDAPRHDQNQHRKHRLFTMSSSHQENLNMDHR